MGKLSIEGQIRASNLDDQTKDTILGFFNDRRDVLNELIGARSLIKCLLMRGPIEVDRQLYENCLREEVIGHLSYQITLSNDKISFDSMSDSPHPVNITDGTSEQTGS